ncbi:anthranilate phosphoribosyltransferase [Arenicella xantha]|uniref:Anthranilate phosphoribosyltransferase n=1 Tax=Arenicella xantha TaxID=644221 RepID=A0A395JLE5_9GAMM|nr:anthranilate phosphoribosyltransferase [Arenicella xantha]RBP49842.1 anthranilate phosphoribosyltransferase [Arenicella xantha]
MQEKNYTNESAIREAIQSIAVGPDRGRDISRELASQVMRAILRSDVDDVQAAIFLIALRMKRESMDEFAGIFDALADQVVPITASVDRVVCLADPFDGYVRSVPMTPFLPAVLAALGVSAVLHGVESVGPKHGVTAHKVYRLAGMNPLQSVAQAAAQLDSVGWAYVDQQVYAQQLASLAVLRDKMIKRTAVTTLERLLMPIRGRRTTHMVLGYVHSAYPEIYARIARQAGYDSVLLAKGVEGGLAPALNKPLRRFFFESDIPFDASSSKEIIAAERLFDAKQAALPASNAESPVAECLDVGLKVLDGASGMARDSLCLAAGQIIFAHQPSLTLTQAVENVRDCLDNGTAKARFYAMIEQAR